MTREQRRADAVSRQIANVGDDKKLRQAYGARAHKFGIMVRTNGLLRTVSYLVAKSNAQGSATAQAYKLFADHIAHSLADLHPWNTAADPTPVGLVQALQGASLSDYMTLTRESLALADWFRRFAQSVLGVEAGAELSEP